MAWAGRSGPSGRKTSTKTCRRTCAIPEQNGQTAGAVAAEAVSVADEIVRTSAAKAVAKR